jgi:hypothetical protein
MRTVDFDAADSFEIIFCAQKNSAETALFSLDRVLPVMTC